jgi:hypothetical protein
VRCGKYGGIDRFVRTTAGRRRSLKSGGVEFIDENGGGRACACESGNRRRASRSRRWFD